MTEIQREKLLGYLLSALDESESAAFDREVATSDSLHSELNKIASELQPLSILRGYYEDAENAPSKLTDQLTGTLTERTCARIWNTLDAESPETENHAKNPTVENSDATFHESLLALAENFTAENFVAETCAPEIPEIIAQEIIVEIVEKQEEKNVAASEKVPVKSPEKPASTKTPALNDLRQRSRRKLQTDKKNSEQNNSPSTTASILLSIAIGALIAVILFPVLNFVKDKVVMRVAQVFMLGAEDNLEKYKKSQEKSFETNSRENVGSFLTAHTQWHLIPQTQSLVDHSLEQLTPDVMESLPLPQRTTNTFSNSTSVEIAGDFLLLAEPKSQATKNQTVYPFHGECIFINEEQVYFRRIPTR